MASQMQPKVNVKLTRMRPSSYTPNRSMGASRECVFFYPAVPYAWIKKEGQILALTGDRPSRPEIGRTCRSRIHLPKIGGMV